MIVRWFMNSCQRHQETIALMAAGLGTKPDHRRANDHLQACAHCRAYFRELARVSGAISRLRKAGVQAAPSAELRTRWTSQIMGGAAETAPVVVSRKPFQRQNAPRKSWIPLPPAWLGWGLATASCVVLAFFLGYRHGRVASGDPLENVRMVRETLAMFPHRVRAIVEDEHGMSLVLSDNDDVPSSAPLYVHVCDGRHCSSFLTFSGQEITVAGETVSVLEDAHGGVILTGKQFVWSNAGPTEAGDNWKIEAKNLTLAAM